MKFFSCLMVVAVCCLKACTQMSERDPVATDSLSQTFIFSADIDIAFSDFGYGSFGAIINAELSDGEHAINSDSTIFFVNSTPMSYSVGVGNYYDRYPRFRIEFDEKSDWEDTLRFSVILRDSSQHNIGFFVTRSIIDFLKTKALYRQVSPDRSKTLIIDWGGNADHVIVERTTTKRTKSGESINSDILADQEWNESKPIKLAPAVFTIDSGKVNNLYINWVKESNGVTTNDRIGAVIRARAEVQQQIAIDNED